MKKNKKIVVSYSFEVHKYLEIDVDELVDYLNNETEIEDVIKKFIEDPKTDSLRIDSSDELDENIKDLEYSHTIEEYVNFNNYLMCDKDCNDFELEDLRKLRNKKVKYELRKRMLLYKKS